ncbi:MULTISPECIES: nuclear transport factor 2 family protein [unclassified Streptomyces]|uniref:nuclear transport factor 2 family protein n=1 Tax=unclassified Streptomyces TaxID=2593676 RepID=UPI00226F0C1C|nr:MULTISPECIES: nuclear transport factor 2 family protein [unclassified Streptomyces]MCY0918640.1 nuclear transport factor 2 family protein [Streptomyces sp. H27-G5]MCY0961510.1 nuclear transport factor 2 family protein [Streptomyces sp. H27-H5]
MSEHPDCALIRRGYEAFGKGDLEALGAMMTADVIHHMPGHNPLSGHHKGRETVLGLYRRLAEETNGTLRLHLESVLADGRGHVMSFHTACGDRGDRGIEIREGLFFTIVGHKITDIDGCTEDIDEADAFWSARSDLPS